MTDPIPVLLATAGLPGEAAIVAALDRPDGATTVERRCLDLADLLGAAATHRARAAVVDAALRRLDRDAVERLQAAGLAVVLLASAEARAGVGAVGAPVVVVEGADDAERVVAAVVAAAEHARQVAADSSQPPPEAPTLSHQPAPVVPGSAVGSGGDGAALSLVSTTEQPAAGRLVVVWGPHGAPGRTSVALTLADEVARLGVRTWLVDADTTAPSIAQRLALLDDQAGLVVATRLAGTGRLAPVDLARLAVTLGSGLRVLTGLSRPERWAELRPAALRVVWEQLLGVADLVVVDVGAGIERDDETLLDPGLPSRHGAALATLACADRVVAVGSADPIGLVRLARGLDTLVGLAPGAARDVVVNRVRHSGVGAHGNAQLREVLRGVPSHTAHFVPDEPAAWDAALFAGSTLAEAAPRAAGREAIAGVLAHEFAPARTRRRRGRTRSTRHAAG